MGYRASIQQKVRAAFNQVGDLASNAILTQKDSSSFDFATQTTVKVTQPSKAIKVILINEGRDKSDSNTITAEVMILSENVSDLTYYDTIVINGITWTIGTPSFNDGFITTVKVKRE